MKREVEGGRGETARKEREGGRTAVDWLPIKSDARSWVRGSCRKRRGESVQGNG